MGQEQEQEQEQEPQVKRVMEDQEKVVVMVMVMVEENQDEHYFVVVFVDLGHIVQPNVDCVHQGLEKEVFERAVVLVEFHFAPDSDAPLMLVDTPVIVFGVLSVVVVTYPAAVAPVGPAFLFAFEAELVSDAPNIFDTPNISDVPTVVEAKPIAV
jgi:hypothetical protein